jgi:phosphocarrier protein
MRLSLPILVIAHLGLHARPSAMFLNTVNRFSSKVWVTKDGETVDGKSIMGLMMLAAGPGSVLIVESEGPDAAEALTALSDLGDFGFGDYSQRIDDIYQIWQEMESDDRFEFHNLQKVFATTEDRLEFDRFVIGDISKGHGVSNDTPGLIAIVAEVHFFDKQYVERHELSEEHCSELAGGGPFVVYDYLSPYCGCLDLIAKFDLATSASTLKNFYTKGGSPTVCAIGFELLFRKGAIFASELIEACEQQCNALTIAALLRLIDDSKEVRDYVVSLVNGHRRVPIIEMARSAALTIKHPDIHAALQCRLFAEIDPLVRYSLADAMTCVDSGSLAAGLDVLRRLLHDADASVRWRAMNTLNKLQEMQYAVPPSLVEIALTDANPLVRHEASRKLRLNWRTNLR